MKNQEVIEYIYLTIIGRGPDWSSKDALWCRERSSHFQGIERGWIQLNAEIRDRKILKATLKFPHISQSALLQYFELVDHLIREANSAGSKCVAENVPAEPALRHLRMTFPQIPEKLITAAFDAAVRGAFS